MKLIIGGAFQGKKKYVKEKFSLLEEQMTDGKDADYEDIFHCTCLYHFHEWVKKGLEQGKKQSGHSCGMRSWYGNKKCLK